MKIIRKGHKKPREAIEKIKKCGNCGTVFSYTREDFIEIGYSISELSNGLSCPVCKEILIPSIFDRKVLGVFKDGKK